MPCEEEVYRKVAAVLITSTALEQVIWVKACSLLGHGDVNGDAHNYEKLMKFMKGIVQST